MRDFDLKYPVRTDLADESASLFREKSTNTANGVTVEKDVRHGFPVQILEVLPGDGEKLCGKAAGRYMTLDIGKIWTADKETFEACAYALSECIREFIPKDGACLVAGLGNRGIIADATGPLTAENFVVTRHIKSSDRALFDSLGMRETLCICPGVLGSTGIEAQEVVKGAVETAKPAFVVAIDSLAARNTSRLATTVQITSCGITPGSGIHNARKELSARTLGVPVIAIGVPTVVEVGTLAADLLSKAIDRTEHLDKATAEALFAAVGEVDGESFFVTPKETDHIIKDVSKLLGYGLNLALHEGLTFSDIDEFLS